MSNQTQPIPDRKFSKADYDLIWLLRKIPNFDRHQSDEVLRLYRKYVQYVYSYRTDCNCSSSIWNLWNGLNDYVSKNDSLFEK